MLTFLRTFDRWVGRLLLGLALVSASTLLLIMASTVLDVSQRFLMDRSIQTVVELNKTLLICVVFSSIGIAQRLKAHIRVELLTMRLPARLKAALWLLVLVVAFAFLGILSSASLQDAIRAYGIKEFTFGGGTRPFPVWWAKFLIPLGCWAMCAQLLVDIAYAGMVLAGRVPPMENRRENL